MVILLQEKNFGPNVIYFVAGHWRAPERVQVHPNVSRYTPSWKGPSLSYPINYYKRNVAIFIIEDHPFEIIVVGNAVVIKNLIHQ